MCCLSNTTAIVEAWARFLSLRSIEHFVIFIRPKSDSCLVLSLLQFLRALFETWLMRPWHVMIQATYSKVMQPLLALPVVVSFDNHVVDIAMHWNKTKFMLLMTVADAVFLTLSLGVRVMVVKKWSDQFTRHSRTFCFIKKIGIIYSPRGVMDLSKLLHVCLALCQTKAWWSFCFELMLLNAFGLLCLWQCNVFVSRLDHKFDLMYAKRAFVHWWCDLLSMQYFHQSLTQVCGGGDGRGRILWGKRRRCGSWTWLPGGGEDCFSPLLTKRPITTGWDWWRLWRRRRWLRRRRVWFLLVGMQRPSSLKSQLNDFVPKTTQTFLHIFISALFWL